MPWKKFEEDASNFLKNKIKEKDIIIKSLGGSDSTAKDIKIFKKNKLKAIIEIKEENAQMGQLVVIFNQEKSKFVLSKKSIDYEEKLKISSDILKYLNNNFKEYKNPSQKGLKLKCNKEISYNYLDKFNRIKKYDFFLSKNKNDEIKLVEVKNFKKYFDIIPIIRRKKSGSAHLNIKDYKKVETYIKKIIGIKIIKDKKGYFLTIPDKQRNNFQRKSDRYFVIGEDEFYLSPKDNIHYIKKCSKTNNPNIIFEIRFSNTKKDDDLNLLLNSLKNWN